MDDAIGSSSKTTLDMLAEIGVGTAQQLVTSVRYANAPPGLTFIPPLDDILLCARPHPGGSSLQRGDLIELIGPSGAGKTTLLSFVLTTTLLPSHIDIPLPAPGSHVVRVPLGGAGSHAFLLQPTSHAPMTKAIRVKMFSHIQDCILDTLSINLRPRVLTPALKTIIQGAIHDALSRLHIIRFTPRWKQLYLALSRVLHPPELKIGTSSQMDKVRKQTVSTLVIDGFGDPFWPERWAEEDKRLKRSTMPVANGDGVGLKEIMRIIQTLRVHMGTVVYLSVQSLWGKPTSPFFVPHLPAPYPHTFSVPRESVDERHHDTSINIQLTLLGRVRPLQLPADLTLVNALREATAKDWTMAQHFEGIARVHGGEGAAGSLAGQKFSFKIGSLGVEVWSGPQDG
ncbi:hypothetical protein BD324DRAFT_79816 [Kockovaella imperatae]|uniref:P-loop containing nucleoside triphosphate hydrolase protein n=1 Tax=Kockovaella imperatae TaxID=4999 RepID=A0A1Y1UCK8_9TREE|nr:hypothetical protein BD324DRAFT_79816 [Kockovaella imperatae]ORX35788.1 hypothetical protein BD324DRAFT_79816 [Kockovaella imperatae]